MLHFIFGCFFSTSYQSGHLNPTSHVRRGKEGESKPKNAHTSQSADEAEKKGIPSVALQVPFLTTWEGRPSLDTRSACPEAFKPLRMCG